jgi:hypothetical protein
MGKQQLIPIIAFFILLLGSGSSLYVYATTTTSETLTINSQEYTIDQLLYLGELRTIESYTGIALDTLLITIGVAHPEENVYTLIGSDGYQKTVRWENLNHGLLTEEKQSIFSDLPKAFHVKDIVRIEVK